MRLTDTIVVLSFAAITAAMVMTVGDICVRMVGRIAELITGVRPRWGLRGLVDLTQLAIMGAVPLAMAAAFFSGAHIRVDVAVEHMSPLWRRIGAVLAALLCLALLGFCLFTAWRGMQSQLDFTTTSATLGIPYTWYWAPLIAGFALALIACLGDLLRALTGRIDPKSTTHDI